MNRFFRSLKIEGKRVASVFLFFLIAFFVINETESFLFKKAGLHPYSFLDLIVAAALVAKIFIVLDHLPLSGVFRKRPLIYHVLYKTALYWFVAFIVRMSIRFFHYLLLKEALAEEWEAFYTHMNWNLLISIQSWYLMLVFLYVAFRELARVIGPVRMREIFLGKS